MKISAALELALQLMAGASRLTTLIKTARAEGRDELTAVELNSVIVENDAAATELLAAIAAAKASPPAAG